MLSLRDWREINEITAEPITSEEPAPDDWEFYTQKVQGKAAAYLKWFTEEIRGKKLSPYKKGFVIQEVMDALGLDIAQVVKITTNIKRAMQKKNAMTAHQPMPNQGLPNNVYR
jgi:hypothetical protein